MQQEPEPQRERWHVGKEVPLTLLFALLVQTVLFAAFISDLKNEVRSTGARVEEIWRDRYTRIDAAKDAEITRARDDIQNARVEDHERRLREIESVIRAGGNSHLRQK
ncbi:MAG TPA: hypothetical protein P5024_12570 [Burkholderiaceae bacterium]|nr:hypothetical protein [Burkholderiaceae bacterium]